MTTLSGNPYSREADTGDVEPGLYVQAQAALAVAHEQHTANLIALADLMLRATGGTVIGTRVIAKRLGLEPADFDTALEVSK